MRVRCEDPNSLAVQLHSIFVVLKISYEIKIKRLETEKKKIILSQFKRKDDKLLHLTKSIHIEETVSPPFESSQRASQAALRGTQDG
jgi:hypothetical protein